MTDTLFEIPSPNRGGIGGHTDPFRGRTDDWLTPPDIIRRLGPFDLDPCAAPAPRPWDTARTHYNENGLMLPWEGRVWCNPPYGNLTGQWLDRLALHGRGVALVFARTETDMFFSSVWGKAKGILFISGRLYFHYPDGRRADANSGGPSVLIAYGEDDARRLAAAGIAGAFIDTHRVITSSKE